MSEDWPLYKPRFMLPEGFVKVLVYFHVYKQPHSQKENYKSGFGVDIQLCEWQPVGKPGSYINQVFVCKNVTTLFGPLSAHGDI